MAFLFPSRSLHQVPRCLRLSVLMLSLGLVLGAVAAPDEEKPPLSEKDPKGEHSSGKDKAKEKDKDKGEPDRLTQEEREKIRQVLAQAWEDPEVVAARTGVHLAMEEYRTSLENAVERIDPEAVALMKRMHQSSRQEAVREKMGPHRFGPGGPGRPPTNPRELVQRYASGEPAFDQMNSEDKERFLALAEKLRQDGLLDEALEEIENASSPKDYGQARGNFRKVFIEAMRNADPWAKEAIDAAPEPKRWSPDRDRGDGEKNWDKDRPPPPPPSGGRPPLERPE